LQGIRREQINKLSDNESINPPFSSTPRQAIQPALSQPISSTPFELNLWRLAYHYNWGLATVATHYNWRVAIAAIHNNYGLATLATHYNWGLATLGTHYKWGLATDYN
jgi:hypothetical protein